MISAGFFQDSSTGKWLAGEIDSEQYLSDIGWECSPEFREIDGQLLHKHLWTPKLWGSWKHEEHILVLEARALNKALNRVALTKFGKNIRQLMLVDSMSVALRFDRCRSRSFKLLKQVRRYASTCLARNIDPHVRWIPSELNSADEPSRIDASEPSKTLFGQIPVRRNVQTAEEIKNLGATRRDSIFEGKEAPIPSTGQSEREAPINEPSTDPREDISEVKAPYETNGNHTHGFEDSGFEPDQEGEATSESNQFGQFQFINLSGGQEEREEFDPQKQTPLEEVCGRGNGSRQSRLVIAGEEGYRKGGFPLLHHRVCGVHSLCPQEWPQSSSSTSGGCGNDQVHEPSLSSGSSITPRRQTVGSLHASPSRVQPVWIKPIAPCLSSSERLEKVGSGQLTEGLSFGSVGCHSSGVGSYGFCEDGTFHYDPPFSLHPAKRADPLQDSVIGSSYFPGDRSLVTSPAPGGAQGQIKDRGVRRQHSVRLSLFEALGLGAIHGAQKATKRKAVVGLRLSELLPDFHAGCKEASVGDHPLQYEALRPINRQGQKCSPIVGGAEAGKMEKSQKRDSLREVSKVSSQFQSVPHQSTKALPARRDTSRGCDAGPYQTAYVADLFAGKGGVAHQCRRLG